MNYQNKLIFYITLGSSLEFFDFTIYALISPYISLVFFPEGNKQIDFINTLAVFAVGYLARPFGSLVFGHLGDLYGRKNTFTLTIALMAISTLGIGILPGFATLGILSPILLVLLRIIQGISLGGEIAGSAIFVAEHCQLNSRGSAVAWIFAGVTFGNVAGGLFVTILEYCFNFTQMVTWGWRIPFFIGCLVGLFSYFLRKNTKESPIFVNLNINYQRTPVIELINNHLGTLLLGISITALMATNIFTLLYLPVFFKMNVIQLNTSLFSMINFLFVVIFGIIFGYYSNVVGRKKILITGCILSLTLGYPLLQSLIWYPSTSIFFFPIIFGIIAGMINGSYGCMLVEMFPAHIRYSGVSLAYNIAFALFGGLAPLINVTLQAKLDKYFSLYYLLAIGAVLTLITACKSPDRKNQTLKF